MLVIWVFIQFFQIEFSNNRVISLCNGTSTGRVFFALVLPGSHFPGEFPFPSPHHELFQTKPTVFNPTKTNDSYTRIWLGQKGSFVGLNIAVWILNDTHRSISTTFDVTEGRIMCTSRKLKNYITNDLLFGTITTARSHFRSAFRRF